MRLRALDMTLKRGVLNVLAALFLFGCQGEQEMTFNIPKDLELVSTTVTDSTPAHSATTLYLEEDEVQYEGGVYIMPLEKNNDVPTFDSAEPYSRGEYVVYSGVASSLERDVSQAINVPLTASANYASPSFDKLTSNFEMYVLDSTVLSSADSSRTMAISGNTMFVMSHGASNALTSFDISDPTNLIEISNITNANFAGVFDMKVYKNILVMVSATLNNITTVDVSDTSNMIVLNSLTGASMSYPTGVAVANYVAYAASYTSDSVTSFDISDPTSISELHHLSDAVNLNGARCIEVVDSTVVVGGLLNVFTSVDISTPSAMSVVNSVSTTSPVANISIFGDVAYGVSFGTLEKNIMSFDISNTSSMSEIGVYEIAALSTAGGIAVVDDIAYVIDRTGVRLFSIDVSDPTNMFQIQEFRNLLIDVPYFIIADENVVYIASDNNVSIVSVAINDSAGGLSVGLYRFERTWKDRYFNITITRISDSVVMASGELYYLDSESHITRYFGTGCTSNCGTDRLVWIGDDKLYVFTASYTHTNGAIAADFRDTYLAPYGFTYVRPTRPSLPFDTKQYTSVIETGNQTWVVKSLTAFDGVALGRVRGDTISITFKDSLGATVGTPVVDQTINNIIDTSLPDAYTTEIFYASSVIEANGTVEITIKGTETEIGKIFPTASYVVGSTNLQFSHEIVDFSKEQVSAISGAVDRIEGNKVIDYKGSYDIEMVDYDKAVMLQKYMTGRLVAIDGSDMINNEVADGQGRFASTKIICRIRRLSMKSTVKDDDIAVTTPISFEFREIV